MEASGPMQTFPSTRASKVVPRVSLACVECRSRHIKCNAAVPICSRCEAEGKQCVYVKSRRGGCRRVAQSTPSANNRADAAVSNQQASQTSALFNRTGIPALSSNGSSRPADNTSNSNPILGMLSPAVNEAPGPDQLVDSYYKNFHSAHPCVLPKWALQLRMAHDAASFELLLPVMRYIGSLFDTSVPSEPLEKRVISLMNSRAGKSSTGYDVQAIMLYSICVYWNDQIERGLILFDDALRKALELGMNLRGFATDNGNGDPIIEESWRRTWWQLYVTDAMLSGSTHVYPFRTSRMNMDVVLPCEESFYESGVSEPNTPPFSLCFGTNEHHPDNTSKQDS